MVQWDKEYTTEEELIQVRTRIAEDRRKTMIGTTYKKNSNFRLPPLLFFANLASLWSSYTAAKKFLSLFHMCELVVLEGHLPSITACEKEKKNHQLWRNTNTECKGSVAIKNYYFCVSRPFGNYLSRDLSPYCERDVKKCHVLASKWESMVEGF